MSAHGDIWACLALIALLLVAATLALPAGATSARLAIEREPDITWVQARVRGEAHKIVIRIQKPTAEGYELWQRCRFPYSGAGSYDCGLDHDNGSGDRWQAKVVIDNRQITERRFRP